MSSTMDHMVHRTTHLIWVSYDKAPAKFGVYNVAEQTKYLTEALLFAPAANKWASDSGIMNYNGGLLVLKSGSNLSELTNPVEARINLGLRIGVDVQGYSDQLTAYANAPTPSPFGLSLVTRSNASDVRDFIEAGTVSRVTISGGTTGLVFTDGDITRVGTATLTGTLAPTSGGTGVTSLSALKTSLNLNNVNNTSDANKPISTAVQTALDGKFNNPSGNITQYIRGDGTLATLPTFTPSALTKTDDTNVTLTLGGTPSTALLQATSITVGWSGTLAQARGGFGQNVSAVSGYAKAATGTFAFSSTIPGSDVSGNIAGSAANVTGTVAIANGGTGASTAAAARTNLGTVNKAGDTFSGNLFVDSNGSSTIRSIGRDGGAVLVSTNTIFASSDGSAQQLLRGYKSSTSGHSLLVGEVAYGTSAVPEQIGAANVNLVELSVRPLASDLATFAQPARLTFWSTSAHSSTNLGVYSAVDLCADGSTTRTRSVTFYAGTGTSTIADVFEAAGNIKPSSDNVFSSGTSSRRWSVVYAGTGTINTSDERQKRDIQEISDELLDAWADVNWVAYRFKDAYEIKGEDARWHFGAIAQQIRDVIDSKMGAGAAIKLGLVCYDEWSEQLEETVPIFDDEGNDTGEIEIVKPYRPAGNAWGLRYTECFALEAAYQRRRMDRIEAALTSLGM